MKKYAKEFVISTAEQRSPAWFKERAGIPSASALGFLFDTLKDGYTPSAKAKKYLRQLAFERKFGVTFENFVTKPMADGIFFEDFAKMVYTRDTDYSLQPATSYISDWFIATPDAYVLEPVGKVAMDNYGQPAVGIKFKRGLLECKIVGDKTFMTIMEEGLPLAHELQLQGQLMASGLDWVDYIVVNLKTRAYFIERVHRNNKLIKRIYERLHEPLELPKLRDGGVRQFDQSMLQDYMGYNKLQEEDLIIEDLPF